MEKAKIIEELCRLLIQDTFNQATKYIEDKYPFTPIETSTRSYSKQTMCKIFVRDGFIDRYTGEKLIFPGLLRLLTHKMPTIFQYHPNWKMTETHQAYWDLSPTIDHLIPIAKGVEMMRATWLPHQC